MKRPVAIDLFAGCGGMSLGLEAAGFDIAAAVEVDPIHLLIHHFNFPYSASLCQDISQLKSATLLQVIKDQGYSTEIDLIAGGPPCQGFSHIGKRQLHDPRNSLVFDYLRMIKDLQPKYFIFENVPGMVSGDYKNFLEELIFEFERIGYRIEQPFKILDASCYGAPQKRKRLILLGSRHDVTQARYPSPTHCDNFDNQTGNLKLKPLTTVGEAIGDLENYQAFIGNDLGIPEKNLDYSGFRESFSFNPKGFYQLCYKRSVKRVLYGHIGSNHTPRSVKRFQITTPGSIEPISRFFKLTKEGQCNTLRSGTGRDKGAYTAPRPIHYAIPRCITVREAARLHTFPDWFRFHNTIWHGFREIGNAVIPLLSKALGDEVIHAMGLEPQKFDVPELLSISDELLNFKMDQASKYWCVSDDVIPKRKRFTNIARNLKV
jgi:DNA (cytosine-5)-methyltransferase 1